MTLTSGFVQGLGWDVESLLKSICNRSRLVIATVHLQRKPDGVYRAHSSAWHGVKAKCLFTINFIILIITGGFILKTKKKVSFKIKFWKVIIYKRQQWGKLSDSFDSVVLPGSIKKSTQHHVSLSLSSLMLSLLFLCISFKKHTMALHSTRTFQMDYCTLKMSSILCGVSWPDYFDFSSFFFILSSRK